MIEPQVAGFVYDESDPAAYRIKCLDCGATAGTLAPSEDYAHGWLDSWAEDHLVGAHSSAPRAVSLVEAMRQERREAFKAYAGEISRLQGVLNDLYPVLASRVIQLKEAGEEKAVARWNGYCKQVLAVLKENR